MFSGYGSPYHSMFRSAGVWGVGGGDGVVMIVSCRAVLRLNSHPTTAVLTSPIPSSFPPRAQESQRKAVLPDSIPLPYGPGTVILSSAGGVGGASPANMEDGVLVST